MDLKSVILSISLFLGTCIANPQLPGPPGPHGPPGPPGPRGFFAPPGPPHGGNMRKIMAECRNKTGINKDEMENIMMHQIPKTKNEGCMLACVNKKMGIMGDDNKINVDKIKQKHSHMAQHNAELYNKTVKIYQDCKAAETAEPDECIAARKIAECIIPREKEFTPPPPPSDRIMRETFEKCRDKYGISKNEHFYVMSHKMPQTRNEQCVFGCMEKKFGFIGADNKINMTKINEHFSFMKYHNKAMFNKTLKLFTDCKANETTETDECVAAKNYAECVIPKERAMRPRPGFPPHFDKFMEECKNKTGANEMEANIAHRNRIPKSKNEQCMLACIEKKKGWRGNDNKIVFEKIKRSFASMKHHRTEMYDKMLQVYQECVDAETAVADECTAALKFAQCVIPKMQSLRRP